MRKQHSNRKRPSCDTCHRVMSSYYALRQHIDAFHNTKERPRLPCTFLGCEKTYQNRSSILHHARTEHSENPVRFPCTLCKKEFKTRTELEIHIPTHTTEKPYNCATCGRRFANRGYMKLHETTHLEKSARKVSKCHICTQIFFFTSGLQNHIRVVHENQKNYPCQVCDKRFSKPSELKFHVEARHATNKEPVHSCDKCEFRSHWKGNLSKHRLRHNPARHECYFCGKKFFVFHEFVHHF
ncbi:Zinc finger protein 25 [Folsomia candida]|uniref:Zinc finger protein 25 n=2 Tax=Folsomia candida TaxID=158441 RepID=A0A226DH96_FOLCA|nr:Zinc finger protein 25 [Folsomia candida]